MNAEISIYDYAKQKEKRFLLPSEFDDMKSFITPNRGYKITDIEDKYNFFIDIEAYYNSYEEINELVKLIEKNSDEESTITKLSFHFDLTKCDIIELVDNFEDIIDKYDMYDNYRTIEDWAEDNNKIYNFIDSTNVDILYTYFDNDLLENLLRDSYVTYDFSYIDDFYEQTLEEILELLDSQGFISSKYLNMDFYLNWEIIVKQLRANAFYIDKFKNKIIVYHG